MYNEERQEGERVAIYRTPSLSLVEASRTTDFGHADLNRGASLRWVYVHVTCFKLPEMKVWAVAGIFSDNTLFTQIAKTYREDAEAGFNPYCIHLQYTSYLAALRAWGSDSFTPRVQHLDTVYNTPDTPNSLLSRTTDF